MRHVAALAASAARPIIFREAAYIAVLACARVSIRERRPAFDKEGLCDGARFVVVLNAQPARDAATCEIFSHRRREARTSAYCGNECMISHLGSSGANSMSAAKAEKPAPNVRSIPFWPGCGRPLSRISRKTNRTDGDDMLP